ncbi:MAG: hypothetical protein AB7L36_07710 [Sphingomonadaceae bacterium]
MAATRIEPPHLRSVPSGIRERECQGGPKSLVGFGLDRLPQHRERQPIAIGVHVSDRSDPLEMKRATLVHFPISAERNVRERRVSHF